MKKILKWIVIAVIAIIVVGAIAGGTNNSDEEPTASTDDTTEETTTTNEETTVPVTTPETEPEEDVPTEYKSALRQAKSYSENLHMSKQGIYDQLVSEYGGQFTPEIGRAHV